MNVTRSSPRPCMTDIVLGPGHLILVCSFRLFIQDHSDLVFGYTRFMLESLILFTWSIRLILTVARTLMLPAELGLGAISPWMCILPPVITEQGISFTWTQVCARYIILLNLEVEQKIQAKVGYTADCDFCDVSQVWWWYVYCTEVIWKRFCDIEAICSMYKHASYCSLSHFLDTMNAYCWFLRDIVAYLMNY